jgi:hypothetical protein
LPNPKTDSGNIAIFDGTEDDLPGRFRPSRKKYLSHQAADLLFAEPVRIPGNRLTRRRRLWLGCFRLENVARQRLFQ